MALKKFPPISGVGIVTPTPKGKSKAVVSIFPEMFKERIESGCIL